MISWPCNHSAASHTLLLCCFLLTEDNPGPCCLIAYPICKQKPPFSELRCWSEVGWLTRHVISQGHGTLLHLHSCEWRARYNKTADAAGAGCQTPITRLFCFSHPILNGTVGLFLAREDYRSKVMVLQSCLFTWKCLNACVPRPPGNEQHTVVLLPLFKTAFPLSSACPNFLSPGHLSQDNSLHYFSLFFPGFQPLIRSQQPAFFLHHLQLIPSGQVLIPDTLTCNALCKFLPFWAVMAFRGCFSLSIWLG